MHRFFCKETSAFQTMLLGETMAETATPTPQAPTLDDMLDDELADKLADQPADQPLGSRFTALLTVTGLANLGDGVVQLGAPLVALTLTRSPVQISLLAAAAWLPWLILGLAAGVVVDRRDRRWTQVIAMAARAALLAVGAWLLLTGHMTMALLVAIVLAYGVTEVFADLAQSALVPDLVPRSRLSAANGRVLATQQVANTFVGGPVAALLLTLGAAWVLGIPAAMALAAVLVLLRGIPGSYKHASDERKSATAEVREGVVYLWHNRVLRPLVLTAGVMNMANTAYFSLFILWVVGPGSRVELRAEHYPIVAMGLAVGAVAGSLVTEAITRRYAELRVLGLSWVLGPALMVVPVLSPTIPTLAATVFAMGFIGTVGNTISQSLRQRIVPARMLGRVSGASRTLVYGLMPLGAVLGGLAAERWGLAPVLVAAAVVGISASLYPLLAIRAKDLADAEAAHAADEAAQQPTATRS